jgi:hypothetical protein
MKRVLLILFALAALALWTPRTEARGIVGARAAARTVARVRGFRGVRHFRAGRFLFRGRFGFGGVGAGFVPGAAVEALAEPVAFVSPPIVVAPAAAASFRSEEFIAQAGPAVPTCGGAGVTFAPGVGGFRAGALAGFGGRFSFRFLGGRGVRHLHR